MKGKKFVIFQLQKDLKILKLIWFIFVILIAQGIEL